MVKWIRGLWVPWAANLVAIAAYSYLIFVLLYVPCVSVMGAIAH